MKRLIFDTLLSFFHFQNPWFLACFKVFIRMISSMYNLEYFIIFLLICVEFSSRLSTLIILLSLSGFCSCYVTLRYVISLNSLLILYELFHLHLVHVFIACLCSVNIICLYESLILILTSVF